MLLRFIILHLIILTTAFFSFQYFIERFLSPRIGMGWAYVFDQITPLAIAIATMFFFLIRKKNLKALFGRLKPHCRLLVLIFCLAFITHLGILYYYFWSEEPLFILEPITQNREFHFHLGGTANLRGYFVAFYALNYLLFGTNAFVYQLLNLTYFAVSALFVYWFVYLLTSKKTISTLAAVFFTTTPAYLDMFTWQNTEYSPVLIMGLVSFIFLLYYKKNDKFIYYILSLMFFFCAIKLGFVRSAGFAFVPLLLLFLPPFRHRKLVHLLMLALPYFAIAIYFVVFEFLNSELVTAANIFNNTGSLKKALNILLNYRGVTENPSFLLPKFFFFITYLFIPSGLVADLLPSLRPLFTNVSIVLTLGKLSLLSMVFAFLIALKYKHSKTGRLVIFALAFIFLNMIHSIIGYQATDDFNPKNPVFADLLDKRFSNESSGYGPGSRYLFASAVGVSLLFALTFARFVKKEWKTLSIRFVLCVLIIAGNTYFTVRAQIGNFQGMTGYKSLVENIFKIVPRDEKPKLLISANPESNNLDRKFGGWEWLYGFYKKRELVYAANLQEAVELFKKGQYAKENIYAFFNNPQTHTFADISQEARDYFFPNSGVGHAPIYLEFSKHQQDWLDIEEREIIESEETSRRIMAAQTLKFKVTTERQKNPPMAYPHKDIFDTAETTYQYIGGKGDFKQLAETKSYGLSVLWICAEDSDWKTQLKNKKELVPGVWNVAKANIPAGVSKEIGVTINCYGSKLRKIFLVSPPHTVKIKVTGAVID